MKKPYFEVEGKKQIIFRLRGTNYRRGIGGRGDRQSAYGNMGLEGRLLR